ncbi:MAG: sporulation integral membrane protein YtvI [Fusicatenibacter sp.]|nr:sporulation integral membrane protein YtvI [Fusicatenibacter sp.]
MEKKKQFLINLLYYLLLLGILLGVCRYLLPLVMPFLIAFFVSFLLQMPVKRFGKISRRKKRILLAIFVGLFYFLLFAAVVFFSIKLLEAAGHLIDAAPAFYETTVLPFLERVSRRVELAASGVSVEMSSDINSMIQNFIENMEKQITEFSIGLIKCISEGLVRIPNCMVQIAITVIATFFITLDYDGIIAFFREHLPVKQRLVIEKIELYVKNALLIYLKSYTLLFLITFLELTLGFLILRIPYAALIGLMIAAFDILPVLGTGGILIPWAIFLLMTKETSLAIGILVLYLIITVIRNILEPHLVGRQIGLHPLATLLAMYLGLKAAGIVGIIAFPVGLTVLLSLKQGYCSGGV